MRYKALKPFVLHIKVIYLTMLTEIVHLQVFLVHILHSERTTYSNAFSSKTFSALRAQRTDLCRTGVYGMKLE